MSDKLRGLVKPLEWEAKLNRTHLYDQWYSYTIVGVYNITDVRGAFEWYLKDNGRIARVATLDEAKSAAQADYEQRVISALNHATVTALLDRIEELERDSADLPQAPWPASEWAINRIAELEHKLAEARAEALEEAAEHVDGMLGFDRYALPNRHHVAAAIRALKSGGANG